MPHSSSSTGRTRKSATDASEMELKGPSELTLRTLYDIFWIGDEGPNVTEDHPTSDRLQLLIGVFSLEWRKAFYKFSS